MFGGFHDTYIDIADSRLLYTVDTKIHHVEKWGSIFQNMNENLEGIGSYGYGDKTAASANGEGAGIDVGTLKNTEYYRDAIGYGKNCQKRYVDWKWKRGMCFDQLGVDSNKVSERVQHDLFIISTDGVHRFTNATSPTPLHSFDVLVTIPWDFNRPTISSPSRVAIYLSTSMGMEASTSSLLGSKRRGVRRRSPPSTSSKTLILPSAKRPSTVKPFASPSLTVRSPHSRPWNPIAAPLSRAT